jgi:hypothetical protein
MSYLKVSTLKSIAFIILISSCIFECGIGISTALTDNSLPIPLLVYCWFLFGDGLFFVLFTSFDATIATHCELFSDGNIFMICVSLKTVVCLCWWYTLISPKYYGDEMPYEVAFIGFWSILSSSVYERLRDYYYKQEKRIANEGGIID